MEVADALGMDELFKTGAECIYKRIREAGKITAPVRGLIDSMADPVRFKLLDHVEPAVFEVLRKTIPPYNHQYQRQLQRLLSDSHFARTLGVDTAKKTYEAVLHFRKSVSAQMQDGACDLDMHSRADRAEFSQDLHHLLTVGRVTHTLTIWDLSQRPFSQVGVCAGVVDAAFGTPGVVFTLELDAHVHVRSMSGVELVSMPCGRADALSVSNNYLLAFSTSFPPEHNLSDPTSASRLWKWLPDMVALDSRSVENSTTACLSPDVEFVVHSRMGAVWTSPVDPSNIEHCRVLQQSDDTAISELGDIMALAVSDDGSTIAAVYVCVIKFWWTCDGVSSLSFDLDGHYHETFGHAAFSPGGRFIALGTWEGNIIMLEMRVGSFRIHSCLSVGAAILHLDWSRDGRFLVVSSYGGGILIDPRRKGSSI